MHVLNHDNQQIFPEVGNDPNDALIILRADRNRGFSAGNNMGISYAQQRNDYKYINC